jgi:hypothetical protein
MSDTQYRDPRDVRIEMLELRVEQAEKDIRELRCPAENTCDIGYDLDNPDTQPLREKMSELAAQAARDIAEKRERMIEVKLAEAGVDYEVVKRICDEVQSIPAEIKVTEKAPATRTKVRLDSLAVGDLFRFEDETYEVDDAPPSVNGYIRVKASGAKLDPWYEIQKNEWVTPVEPENTGEKVVEGMTELRDMLRDEVERAMKAAHGQDAEALSRELDKVIAERESKRDPGDMTAACDKLREIIEPNQEQAEAERKAAAEEVAPGIADTEMVMLSRATFDRVVAHYERHDLAGCAGALRQAARPAKIDEEELREELAERGMDSSWHLHVCDCLRKMGWL